MTTTFVPTLFIQQVVLPLRGHTSDEVYLRCLSALKAHPGLTTGQYLAIIMATLLFNEPPTWPERLATWAASSHDLGCPPGYIAGLVRELVAFRESEPSWMTVPRAIHQGDAAAK
jgi:hypothetical protein